jgi:membrane-associated phospholipid phosphatase
MRPLPRAPLLGAVACLAGLVLTGALSHLIGVGERLDAEALTTFSRLRDTRLDPLLDNLVHLADTIPYLLFSGAVIATAILRSRPRTAMACGVALFCAPMTAQIVKHLTAATRAHSLNVHHNIADASWPSGHATGAMSLALCAVLVAPAVWRPVVALVGGALAIGVGYAVVALVWHYPSDTIGGFFLSALWTLGAIAVLRVRPDAIALQEADARKVEPEHRRELGGWLGGGLALLLFAGGAGFVLLSMRGQADRLVEHGAATGAAVVIAALGGLLAAMLVLTARRS